MVFHFFKPHSWGLCIQLLFWKRGRLTEAKLLIYTPIYIWEKHEPRDHPDKLKKIIELKKQLFSLHIWKGSMC